MYVADWYDARMAHPDPDADWDRSNGRIYRISFGDAAAVPSFDLVRQTSEELVRLLDHPNVWYVRTARRILAERRDRTILPMLKDRLRHGAEAQALEALWAIYVSGGFDLALAQETLHHRNPDVAAGPSGACWATMARCRPSS